MMRSVGVRPVAIAISMPRSRATVTGLNRTRIVRTDGRHAKPGLIEQQSARGDVQGLGSGRQVEADASICSRHQGTVGVIHDELDARRSRGVFDCL